MRLGPPEVSVCVPTYNGSAYVGDCLRSIQAQTFDDFEILVVDDDSDDQTWEIVAQYGKADARIRSVTNPRRLGLVGNWNRCVELSRGEWIKFVFQDDVLKRNCLE